MDNKDIVRSQFDKQAEKFSAWVGTRDQQSLQQLFDFIGISEDDELLDVACGSGEFAVFCGQRIQRVCGLDISEKMIELARKQAEAGWLNNVFFECYSVEELPFDNGRFSVVASRSAFHHMPNYTKIFAEMVRCCKADGSLCVSDIVAYDGLRVSDFFDELDKTMDASHNARMSQAAFHDLFAENGIEIIKAEGLEFEISVQLYASHAIQTEKETRRINELVEYGLNDADISKFLYMKDGQPVFKNRAYSVMGRKGNS